VITEITDFKKSKGILLFDGECALCVRLAGRWSPPLYRRGFALSPLQSPGMRERLGMKPGELFGEMKLIMADGAVVGGADAVICLAKHIWWARPLYWLAHIPGASVLLRKVYKWFARRRRCCGGVCKLNVRRSRRLVFFEMP
jgi:predicted DCC family thiol-disulfide oxidoreductase YuxK